MKLIVLSAQNRSLRNNKTCSPIYKRCDRYCYSSYLVVVDRCIERHEVLDRSCCSDSLRNRLGGGKVRLIVQAISVFISDRENITRNRSSHPFGIPATFAWAFVQRQTAQVKVRDCWCDIRNFPAVRFGTQLDFARIFTSAVSSALMMMIESHSEPVPQARGPSSLERFRSHYLVRTVNTREGLNDNRLFILTACV